jgi:peptidoglycan hydrolase-like protein with peptidoglycan-binding domain
MATLVSPALRAAADGFVKASGYGSAVLSGLVPDRRHLSQGGYHCSVEDLLAYGNGRDYSNTRADDKGFNPKYGAAYDVTMSRADMIRHYKRVYAIFKDKSDPRHKYINAINTWPGVGDPVRLDFVTGKVTRASKDHSWHAHGELRRRYLLDAKAARAHHSVHRGESKATWVAREEKTGAKPPATIPAPPKTAAGNHAPGSRVLQYVPGRAVLGGDDVAFVQRFIGTARAGPADGVAGAKFRSAVLWYQALRGLKSDGIVGKATWVAMGVKSNL